MKVLAVVLGIIFVVAAICAATGILHFSHPLGFDGKAAHETHHFVRDYRGTVLSVGAHVHGYARRRAGRAVISFR